MTQPLESKSTRVKRRSIERAGPLTIDHIKEAGFHYRIASPKNLARYEAMGYEIVKSDQEVGDTTATKSKKIGSAVTVEVGGGRKDVLMRIPVDIYEEIQEEKRENTKKQLDATSVDLGPSQVGTGLTLK